MATEIAEVFAQRVRELLPRGIDYTLEREGEWAHLHVPAVEPDEFQVHVNVGPEYAAVIVERRIIFDFHHPATNPDENVEQILAILRALLSPGMRLRVQIAGARPYRWILEATDGEQWTGRRQARSWVFNWFAPRSERILQNRKLAGIQT